MNNSSLRPFHLAIPVHDLEVCRSFYKNALLMKEGRSDLKWVDFDFYGHQFVIHETGHAVLSNANQVDGHGVPVPHFGVVLTMEDWDKLASHLRSLDIKFIIEPYIRFKGEPGEQATMFLLDPSDNAIELKSFQNPDQLFAS